MEQVRVALAWIAKHHFWLLAALAVLMSTAVWYMASGDLDKRKKTNLGKIKSAFSEQDGIVARGYHANESVNAQQRAQIVALAEETKEIWQQLYDRQRDEVLVWPKQLPKSFRNQVENKQFGDDLDQLRREQYTDYIRGRFDDLPKIVDANEIDDATAAGGGGFARGGGEFGGGGFGGFRSRELEFDEFGNPIEVDYTVYWQDQDQARIKADLDWPTTQSFWRIWVTQEDLWVYETMLRAIAETNESKGASRQSNAAITDIGELQVGREAATTSRTSGRIKRLQGAGSLIGGGEFGRETMMDRGRGMEMSGEFDGGFGGEFGSERGGFGAGTGDVLSDAEEKALRLSRRYIDGEGLPIAVAPDEEPLAPDTFGSEVKRLPVRMVLRMDARWLTALISNLANADLQIKVTEVRVGDVSLEGGGGYGGEFGGRRGGFGSEFGGGFGRGYGDQQIQVFNRKPYMKRVIIQGVVLIFNPPNEDLLDVENGEAGVDDFAMR